MVKSIFVCIEHGFQNKHTINPIVGIACHQVDLSRLLVAHHLVCEGTKCIFLHTLTRSPLIFTTTMLSFDVMLLCIRICIADGFLALASTTYFSSKYPIHHWSRRCICDLVQEYDK